jgi:hypothetical protein
MVEERLQGHRRAFEHASPQLPGDHLTDLRGNSTRHDADSVDQLVFEEEG